MSTDEITTPPTDPPRRHPSRLAEAERLLHQHFLTEPVAAAAVLYREHALAILGELAYLRAKAGER